MNSNAYCCLFLYLTCMCFKLLWKLLKIPKILQLHLLFTVKLSCCVHFQCLLKPLKAKKAAYIPKTSIQECDQACSSSMSLLWSYASIPLSELHQDHLFGCLWFWWEACDAVQPVLSSERVSYQQRGHSVCGAGGPAHPWRPAEECATSHRNHHQFTGGYCTVQTKHFILLPLEFNL